MHNFKSVWDITPATAHPRARRLVGDSIIWNYGDEDSPLGNDVGADTFAAYLLFRTAQPAGDLDGFMREQLASRGFPDTDWEITEDGALEEAIRNDRGFELVRRDDLIIGLAFAQLVLEGTVDAEVRRRAITALQRQGTDVVLSFRGGGGEDGRRRQLAQFQRILELA